MTVKNLLLGSILFVLLAAAGSSAQLAGATGRNLSNGTPTELWRTFYGSPADENGAGVATDASGNVYIAGTGYATWQGDGDRAPLHSYAGQADIFVIKLNSSGVYQWHTFYGSTADDTAAGIAVDNTGNVYVTGTSAQTWQGDGGAKPLHKAGDGFVLKLDSAGTYQWHTFYPFSASGIITGKDNNVLAVGNSAAAWKGDGGKEPLHAYSGGDNDITVIKMDALGTYQWHTFYGPSSATGIAVGSDNNVYVSGNSAASWSGKKGAQPLHAHTGDDASDFVVLALTNLGTYRWHTFYGGPGDDGAGNLALDKKSNIFVTGQSPNSWLGDANHPPIVPHHSGSDTALLKLKSTGAYLWHTFAGGDSDESGQHVALDRNGTPHVSAFSTYAWVCWGDTCLCGTPICPYFDVSISSLKFSANGVYQQSESIGAETDGDGYNVSTAGIATDAANNTLLLGDLAASWANIGNTVHPYGGATDIFVLKGNLAEPVPPTPIKPVNKAVVAKQVQTLDWGSTLNTTGYHVIVREASRKGALIADTNVTGSAFKTPKLTRGSTYFWHVQACNDLGCSLWSPWWRFQVRAE